MRRITAIGLLVLSFTLSGCSSTAQIESSPEPTVSPMETISQAQFDAAAKSFDIEVDEFDESTLVSPILPAKKLDAGVRSGKQLMFMTVNAGKDKGDQSFETWLAVTYFGPDWLFFDSIDLKSSNGSMFIPFESSDKTEEVLDGGNINEIGILTLTDSEVKELSELAKGSDLRFRLNGSGDKLGDSFEGDFSKWMVGHLREGTTLGLGLIQGLSLK